MYVRVQLSLRVRNPYIHVGRSFLKVISARSLLPRTKESYGFLCSTAWDPRRSRPVSCTSLRAVERDNTLINAGSRKWDSVGVWFCPHLEFRACVEASYALELSTPSLWEIGLAQICYHRIHLSVFWSISTHAQCPDLPRSGRTQRLRWSSAWAVFGAQPELPWPQKLLMSSDRRSWNLRLMKSREAIWY